MNAAGSSLYSVVKENPNDPDGAQPVNNPGVVQGALEKSNVNPISTMTQMIDVLRTYQSVTRSLESENERQRNMISKLGDVRA